MRYLQDVGVPLPFVRSPVPEPILGAPVKQCVSNLDVNMLNTKFVGNFISHDVRGQVAVEVSEARVLAVL